MGLASPGDVARFQTAHLAAVIGASVAERGVAVEIAVTCYESFLQRFIIQCQTLPQARRPADSHNSNRKGETNQRIIAQASSRGTVDPCQSCFGGVTCERVNCIFLVALLTPDALDLVVIEHFIGDGVLV